MKRIAALTGMAALIMVLGLASAEGQDGPPHHGHMLVLGLEGAVFNDAGQLLGADDFRKCVDLAGGRALKNNAHHGNIHTGRAGEALRTRAGHVVIPTRPLTNLTCASLEAMFGK